MHSSGAGNSRHILFRAIVALCIPVLWMQAPIAHGQTDTGKPLRFLVPFTPGGGSDLVARAMQSKLSAALGQPVIIENRPGGGITLASNLVAKAAPDGNTILIVTIAHAVNPSLYSELPYDSVKDFTAISMAVAAPLVLVVHPSVQAKTLVELIALAKTRPGVLNYASPGNGSPTHLSAELLKSMTGVDIVHILYKGAGPATTDLLGGQVQLTFSSIGVVSSHIKAGKLRALAVTTARRSPLLPDVPAVSEAALPGYELVSWQAILAPAKLLADVTRKLNLALAVVFNAPEVKDSLLAQGYDGIPGSPEDASRFIISEMERYARIVKRVGVRPD